jgi:hypothetical protein
MDIYCLLLQFSLAVQIYSTVGFLSLLRHSELSHSDLFLIGIGIFLTRAKMSLANYHDDIINGLGLHQRKFTTRRKNLKIL